MQERVGGGRKDSRLVSNNSVDRERKREEREMTRWDQAAGAKGEISIVHDVQFGTQRKEFELM